MGKIINMNKKGIFFTFIAVAVMAIFILVFTPQSDIALQKDTQAVKTRINTLDHFVNDLEFSYFETILRATTYKTILSLIYYMNTTGSYINNLDSAFSDVMITGKINGIPIDSITGKKIMENNTLTDWNNRLIAESKDTLNVDTVINISSVSVFQTSPWKIESNLSVNFSVASDIAEWKKSSIIKTSISIEGFYDPYYLINTNKEYTYQIKKSGVEFNAWNLAKVREHLRNGTYVHWQDSDAPSFLMRFTNTMTNSSCCGIESLVNPNKISPSDRTESYVDYQFWTHKVSDCTKLYNITNPSTGLGLWDEFRYFKLDLNHTIKYNISDREAVGAC